MDNLETRASACPPARMSGVVSFLTSSWPTHYVLAHQHDAGTPLYPSTLPLHTMDSRSRLAHTMNCQLSGIWSVLAVVTRTRVFTNQPYLGRTDDPSISCLLLDSLPLTISFLRPVLTTFSCSNDSLDKDQAENYKENNLFHGIPQAGLQFHTPQFIDKQ